MDPVTIALALAQFAPSLLRFLGVGDTSVAAATKAIEVATSVTGTTSSVDALKVVQENKEAQAQFNTQILAQQTALEEAYLSDRSGARQRDVQLVTALGHSNFRADILAYVSIAGLIAIMYTTLFVQVPAGAAHDIILLLAGSLVAIVKDVYGFEFGSSRSSKDKDAVIAEVTRSAQ